MNRNNKTYILSVNSTKMKELGFRYDFELQDYIYKFPVYLSKKQEPLVFCKLGIDKETNKVFYNVCNIDGTLYTPFYDRYYGKSKVVEIIDKIILKEFKKLGLKEADGEWLNYIVNIFKFGEIKYIYFHLYE